MPGFFRCPAIGEQDATADGDAKFIPYLASWVCLQGWRKYRTALELGHKVPPVNPAAVEATHLERALNRPTYLTDYLTRRRGIDND
jgi:hypothetical protein